MKQFIFAVALSGIFCASAEDSFLYWMVDDTGGAPTLNGTTIRDSYTAKVVAIQGTQDWVYQGVGGTYLNLYNQMSDAASFGTEVGLGQGNNLSYFAGLGSTGSGWTYFIELYNDKGIFAHSAALPYSEQGFAYLSDMKTPGTLWNVSAFVPAAVPEPSSGLLLLLGVAGLALRRRKQIVS